MHRWSRHALAALAAGTAIGGSLAGVPATAKAAAAPAPAAASAADRPPVQPQVGVLHPPHSAPQRPVAGLANPAKCNGPNCFGPLNWYGGPVVHSTNVYIVFWGPLWGQHWADNSMSAVESFVSGLHGSNFQQVLSQYYDTRQVVDWNGAKLAGTWVDNVPAAGTIDPSSPVGIANEAARAQGANAGWGSGQDNLYIVIPQTGASYASGFCGFHGYASNNNQPFYPAAAYNLAVVVWTPDIPSCLGYGDGNGILSSLTSIEAHEYAEATTDPWSNGWHNSSGARDGEIGDLCNGYGGSYAVGGQWVPQLWSDNDNGCVTATTRLYSFTYQNATFQNGVTLSQGHGYDTKVWVQNTGNMPWQIGQDGVVRMGTWNVSDHCSDFSDSSWIGCNRVPLTHNATANNASPVLPGQSAMFEWNFNPHPAVAAGSYTEYFNLVAEGVTWMGCSTTCLNWGLTVGGYNDCYVGQTDPTNTGGAALIPGDSYTASVTFRNCGTDAWWPNELPRLGTSHAQGHNSVWADSSWINASRVDYVRAYTPPNATYTFTYKIHVPCSTTAGTYHEYFDPLAEFNTWMTDYGYYTTFTVGSVPDVTVCNPLP